MRKVILFTGHCIDAPDQPKPLFPANRAQRATQDIAAAIPDDTQIGISSAANGGDILFFEACTTRSIPCHIILPLPPKRFLATSAGY